MILDEIYKGIKEYRKRGAICPFDDGVNMCEWCDYLFPEILYWENRNKEGFIQCPCDALGNAFVKKEMKRLFP